MKNERIPVAVFPLPRIVAFPGHALQFHIFEPRYRKMIGDCVSRRMWLGVAQGLSVRKQKSAHAHHQSVEEFLSSNQENYTPAPVFGAGPVQVLKEFPDGRFIVEVRIERRLERVEPFQHVPYLIVDARLREDAAVDAAAGSRMRDALVEASHRVLGRRAMLFGELSASSAQALPLSELVFSILKWFVIDAQEAQKILEEDDPLARAEALLGWMRYFLARSEDGGGVQQSGQDGLAAAEGRDAEIIPLDFHSKDQGGPGKTRSL